MTHNRVAYVEARNILLERIMANLRGDGRFLAAWLAGSFGRGSQNMLSDLDLHVVVADAYSDVLCARPWSGGAKTTAERLALFSQFGTPAVVYDAHANNLIGGTFTYVLYKESALNVDWMLIPQSVAHLEPATLMLFSKTELPAPPVEPPPDREQCIEHASQQVGFFWMIAAGQAMALVRERSVQFHALLLWLENNIREVRAALHGERASFTKETALQLYCTQEEQVAALRHLCDEMEALMPQLVEAGGYVPASPRAVVEMRLAML